MKNVKHFSKRGLALLLALVMCLGMLQITAFANEAEGDTNPTVVTEETPEVKDETPEVKDETPEVKNETPEVKDETPEVKDETPEVKDETPEVKDETPEVKDETPEVKDETPEVKDETPSYATQADLDTAFEAVGNVDPTADDMTAFIAAMDNYLAVYNRLSPEDQEARAAEMAYVQAYRDQVAAGNPDEEIDTLAAKWHTVTLVPASTNSYASKITSAKVRVGEKVNGYEVTSVSGTTIKVKAWGDLYGDFFLPLAADLWNGAVKSDYVSWAGTGSSNKTEGSSALLPQSDASAYYYFNTAGSVEGGGSSSSGISFTVKHMYYTNGVYDDEYEETQSFNSPTFNQMFSINNIAKETTNPNTDISYTYTSISPVSKTVSKGSTGHQGTFTLRYDRTVAEKVTLTYMDRSMEYAKETKDKGSSFEIKGCTNTRTGYEFKGWSADSSATRVDYEVGDTVALQNNLTVYAVWQKIDTTTDNGNGITIEKTRVSINGNANQTTAEPGDEIEWEITVTNLSNVQKTVTLTEQLTGASLSKNKVTLAAGASETVTATYTVKAKDKGTTIVNTVAGSTGSTGEKENPTATDEGTEVPDPNKITVTWMDGYTSTPIKTETIDKGGDYSDLYPGDPTREGYHFTKWGDPETDGDDNITITAQWEKHNFIRENDEEWVTAPDCIHDGVAKFVCSCGDHEDRTVTGSKLGHSWPSDWTDECDGHEDPGCTGHGQVCDRCKGTLEGGKKEHQAHNYGNWIEDTAATMTSEGTKHRECSNCGHIERGTIPTLDKVTITVKFVDEEGKEVGTETKVVPKDSEYNVTEETGKIPDGYEANGNPTGDPVQSTADSNKTITVPVKKIRYTVTYKWTGLPDGTTDPAVPGVQSYAWGTDVTVDGRAKNSTVTVNGRTYVFNGWDRTGTFEMPKDNVTINGTWSLVPPATHTVTWIDGYNNTQIDQVTVNNGDTNPAATDRTAPDHSGYRFTGWTTTMDGDNIIYTANYTRSGGGGGSDPDPRPPRPDPDPDPTPTPTPDPDPTPNPDPTNPTDPTVDVPDPDVPLVDLPDVDVPMTELPEEVDLPEEEVPMAETPEEVEIPEEDVPLANVPKTGDISALWYLTTLLSAGILAFLSLRRKNRS